MIDRLLLGEYPWSRYNTKFCLSRKLKWGVYCQFLKNSEKGSACSSLSLITLKRPSCLTLHISRIYSPIYAMNSIGHCARLNEGFIVSHSSININKTKRGRGREAHSQHQAMKNTSRSRCKLRGSKAKDFTSRCRNSAEWKKELDNIKSLLPPHYTTDGAFNEHLPWLHGYHRRL